MDPKCSSRLHRDAVIALFCFLVMFRLSTEQNTAVFYMRRATLIEHDALVRQNDHTALTLNVQERIDFEDDDDDRPLPFTVSDSKFNFTVNSTRGMETFANDFFQGNMCRHMFNTSLETPATPKSVVRIRFNCKHLFTVSIYGTGNFISAVYALRMAANVIGNVHIEYVCDDAEQEKANLILPWLTGWFPAAPERAVIPTVQQACSTYKTVPIGHMFSTMQWELRRMAVALVGIPSDDHPAKAWAERHLNDPTRAPFMQLSTSLDDPPIYNNFELDDAVLHFRCGDLISSTHPSFGFMKFGSYSRHLNRNTTRSIGIVTQPFGSDAQVRNYDGGMSNKQKCQRVVYAFVEHLQHEFPIAKISIRNDANETIALTFARMIMARQVVIGISSFGVFPGIATFGEAFIRKPDYARAPNRWLLDNPAIESVAPYVKLVDEPKLMAVTCKAKWQQTNGTAVLDWFQNYTAQIA
jgi:hypothetical protein